MLAHSLPTTIVSICGGHRDKCLFPAAIRAGKTVEDREWPRLPVCANRFAMLCAPLDLIPEFRDFAVHDSYPLDRNLGCSLRRLLLPPPAVPLYLRTPETEGRRTKVYADSIRLGRNASTTAH